MTTTTTTSAAADVRLGLALVERSVVSLEPRFLVRAIRATAGIRHRLSADILAAAVRSLLVPDQGVPALLAKSLAAVGANADAADMDVDSSAAIPPTDAAAPANPEAPAQQPQPPTKFTLPESELFVALLTIIFLHDHGHKQVAISLSDNLISIVQTLNRRTLDLIAGRLYFYHARLYELTGRIAELRPLLLAAHRTATLRHDEETQATIINILLRHYLQLNLVEQADKLVSKAAFPESASNSQAARYTYYLGRIRAIQLDYSASHRHLLQAARKAPQTNLAAGFQQTVMRLSVIVQLLMGEIPERSIFREAKLRKALFPYFLIAQAVRTGDLAKFQDALGKYGQTFRADKNLSLILRLRHNVIKAGVRRISVAYSRISLRDICLKLQLDSEEDAEYIVAKAIRDGVIDATIDHEKGYMKSNENVDIYSTNEPQNAFHQRISFCLDLHNVSVKALRFPLDAHRSELNQVNEQLEKERKHAQELAEGGLDDDDGDDDMMDF